MTDDLITQYRVDNGGRWLFVVHGKKVKEPDVLRPMPVIITVNGNYTAELYDTITGEVKPISYASDGKKTKIMTEMYAFDSLLIRLEDAEEAFEVVLD